MATSAAKTAPGKAPAKPASAKPGAAQTAAAKVDPLTELRRKLFNRLAVASGLVASLLAILAFVDYLATPDEPEPRVFTKPVPVAPRKELSQPVQPATNLPEPPVAEKPGEPVSEAKVEPAKAEAVPAPLPPPVVAANPSVPVPEKTVEKTLGQDQRTTRLRPIQPLAVAEREPKTVPRVPEPVARSLPAPRVRLPEPSDVTYAPPMVPGDKPPPVPASSQPAARVVQTTPMVTPPSNLQRLFSGFVLQAGVFTSQQRAEELHAKLTLSGVPSTLETRVQVGPFKSRQEAEAAQEKLRELGIHTVLVAPKR